MTILQKLTEHARAYALQNSVKIDDFGVSATMIYVMVANDERKALGVTLVPHGEGHFGALQGSSIEDIFESAKAFHPLQRAFALALINALGQHAMEGEKELSLCENGTRSLLVEKVLDLTKAGDEVVFVGNLAPVVAKLKENGRKPIVFCRQKQHYAEAIYSDIFEYEAIQTAPIAIITGATLIGSTLDALLALSPQDSIRILAGFSAGAHPSWFERTGVTHLTSMKLESGYKEALVKNNWEEVFSYPSYFHALKR